MQTEEKPAPKYKVGDKLYALKGMNIKIFNVYEIIRNGNGTYDYVDTYQDVRFYEDQIFTSIQEILATIEERAERF